ncbi:MAG: NAD(P)-dependent glycerol-3-phosphate dehydrogenase [Lachnospiraceae bacterium]|nr:NAD(P)-dependent glycerol-3-phosphate dehydrogenase [Lachnospiraceae bacterium]
MKITILGAGTWGTALAILLDSNGHEVTLWSAVEKEIVAMKEDRTSIRNLPGAVMPERVKLTTDIDEALSGNIDIIVMATASIFVRKTARLIAPKVKDGQIIVNVAKGIEEETLMTMTDIIKEEIPNCEACILSGPTHAEEVSVHIPSTIVAGSHSKAAAEKIQDAFMTEYFRVYTSPDVLGIELGGSLKNVIALAAGIADGLGFGDNTKAALMTRGIAEISRLGVKMGGHPETFSGLSGMGDLMVTCTSKHSRNRNAGFLMGQGKSCDTAMGLVGQVVEGVYSAKAALALSKKFDVSMPIVEQVCQVLFNDKSPAKAVHDLFTRDKKAEHSDLSWDE